MRIFAITAILLGFFSLVGCSENPGVDSENFNSSGTYTNADGTWLAEVENDHIAVYHTDPSDDVKVLYWDGSWDNDAASVTSKRSKRLMRSFTGSILKQKEFAVGTDSISFEYGLRGTFEQIQLSRS